MTLPHRSGLLAIFKFQFIALFWKIENPRLHLQPGMAVVYQSSFLASAMILAWLALGTSS